MDKTEQNARCSSKGAFDAASLLGCSTAATHTHEGLGRSELSDMISLKHGSPSSSHHCHAPQPRRIVEEMLGHIYARPPSAEGKAEQQASGNQNSSSSSPVIKTASSVTSPSSVSGKLLRAKSSSSTSDSINSGKISDKHMLDTSDSCIESGTLPDSPSSAVMQPSSKSNSGKRKSSDASLPDDVDNSVINSLHNSVNESGRKSDSSSRVTSALSQNGKDIKSSAHSGAKKENELKRKKKQHRVIHQESGSDTDIQSNDSSTSSESAETSSSSCSVSDTTNSDSSEDEEDDVKRKRSLEELRKQQQELRKKVQELKQASQEAQAHKQENQAKKSHSPKSSVSATGNNNSAQPSPAHTGTSMAFSGSPCKAGSVMTDTENAVLAPLDLCVKKLDPAADPTLLAGTVLFPLPPVSSAAKSQSITSTPANMPIVTTTLPIGQKRRGRKPKSLLQVPSLVDGQILAKQSKEMPSVLPSQVKTGCRRGRKRSTNKIKKIERHTDFSTLVKTQIELDSANENSDSDDTERSSTGNSSQVPSPKGIKRHYFEEAEGPQKKKRILPDEKDIRIPLEHGWRRQTKIRCFSRSGVRGEVTYYAPCGKKLRNYPEVVRYIQRHGITDISRENFTFSTKINVGEFIEHAQGGGVEDYILVSEQEVMARIEEVRARKGRLGVQGRRSCIQKEDDEQQNHWEEVQSQHSEAHEEAKRQKEHHRAARQQERFDRLEHLRIEREVRAQQMLEEMQKRREMLIMVDLERERRRQHMLLVRALEARKKQEEKERKREEILYEKRLNREKKLEQRRVELQMIREMKKPVEDMCLKDNTPLPTLNRIPGVKLAGKAFADMMMVFEFLHNFGETLGFDMENLPTLNTLQMALLNHDEKCEEELLSVVHHLLVCVINDPGVCHCPEAVSVLGQNLRDVDIANNNVSEVLRLYLIAQNKNSNMCQWLNQRPFLSLNPMQKAEILAFLCNELLCSRRIIRQIDNSIEAVNSLRKDKWIVEGELRKLRCVQQRRAHTNYIKQCVAEDMKAQELSLQKTEQKNNEPSSGLKTNGTKEKLIRNKKDGALEEIDASVGNESGNESDETQGTGHISEAESEDTAMSNDELSKKIERLNKQLTQYQNKLTKACHTIRATTFGQDRYRRRYWVLPYSGGIFVEGRESVDPESEKTEDMYSNTNSKENTTLKSVVAGKSSVKLNSEINQISENKESPSVNSTETKIKEEEEEDTNKKKQVKEESGRSPRDNKEECLPVSDTNKFCTDWTTRKKCLSPISNDILSPFADQCIKSNDKLSNSKLLNSQENDVKLPPSSFLPGDQNWFLQSPFFASILAGSMLFNGPLMHGRELNGSYFNFPKGDSSVQDNSFTNFLGFPPGLLPPEQIAKEQENASNQSKPWFSILPRMPCEHNSLTTSTVSEGDKMPSNTHSISQLTSTASTSDGPCTKTTHSQSTVSGISSLNTNPNPAAIANLHMDILNGIPPNFFMHPFLTPQPFGPTYQSNPSLSSTPHHSTGNSGTANNLLFSGSDFLPNLCNPNLPLPTSSTPSSIPTPSATPGPSYGSAPSSQRETPSPSFCRKYMIDKHEQYDKPQPIPPEFERGWWRITDAEQLKALLNTLHPRGIREKMLQKQFQKLFTYACSSCSKENREATDLEITDLDREISQKLGGAPEPNAEDEWSPNVALRVDMSVLEHVEAMEEKVASASMQVKGWKLQNKISSDSEYIFYPACNSKPDSADEQQPLEDHINETDHTNDSQTESNNEHENILHGNDRLSQSDTEESSVKMEIDCSERTGENKSEVISASSNEKHINPVEAAKERLLLLEAAIERRYLRAPLGTNNELKLCAASTGKSQNIEKDEDNNDIPIGLLRWRDAVQISKTSAQLAMCVNLLEACIAWDKSIMRASCQFCHSGDNEEMLLLCDGCDKGYHTYCFKPKMETIPDGDWYCYECLSKVTGEEVCVLCGKKGKLLSCEGCPKKFHITCLEPPLSKMPKGKWSCSGCNIGKPSKKTTKPKLSAKEKDNSKDHKETPSKKSDSSKSKSAEKREKSKLNKDLSICTIVLDELEKREDAWPFLLPVNTKQFPTYRKIIKKPMDLSTMRNKLENGIYKTRDEVVSDARLIFDNCETFNEDDSPVGQAGHTMRAFFECRWSDLTST